MRGNLAPQYVDVRVSGVVRRAAGVGDQLVLAHHPGCRGCGCAGVLLRRMLAACNGLLCHALQRQAEVVPAALRRAFLQVEGAHHAIGVGCDVHVAERGSGVSKSLKR